MRLSWNEVRNRAADFARDWRDASYEKGETQSFYNDFFKVFGVQRRSVARYEEHVTKLNDSLKCRKQNGQRATRDEARESLAEAIARVLEDRLNSIRSL